MAHDWKNEVLEFLTKWYVWAAYIVIGMVAHVAHLVLTNTKRTKIQSVASVCLAGFVGYLATLYCINYSTPKMGGLIVPMATLSSEKILKVLLAIDWGQLIKVLLHIDDKKQK